MTEQERNNVATATIELAKRVGEKLDYYMYSRQNYDPALQEMKSEILKEIEMFADFVYYEDHDF